MSKSSFVFARQASYEVLAYGKCNISLLKEMLGQDIEVLKTDKGYSTIRIRRVMRDQAALLGLLNTIYELHLSVLFVNMVTDEENNGV